MIPAWFDYVQLAVEGLSVLSAAGVLWYTVQQWLSMQRPVVMVTTEIRRKALLVLVIRNVGKSTASHVSLSLDKPLPWLYGEDIRSAPVFKSGIPVLPPGEEIRYSLQPVRAYLHAEQSESGVGCGTKTWTVTVRYRWLGTRRRYKETTMVSVEHYGNALANDLTVREALQDIAEYLGKEGKGVVRSLETFRMEMKQMLSSLIEASSEDIEPGEENEA